MRDAADFGVSDHSFSASSFQRICGAFFQPNPAFAFRMSFPKMYLLYSILLAFALVVASPWWLFEMLRHGKYRKGFMQRLGSVPDRMRSSQQPCLWVHAVSVGEVLAISEVVRKIRDEAPNYRVVVSTTTDTGQRLAASRFGADRVFYFPFDFAFAVRKWLLALRPEIIVIAETEFWPNFLRLAQSSGARVMVVNARISDRSLPGYLRWKRPLRRVLSCIDLFLAQSSEDARRLIAMGVPPEKVMVAGNLKYDVPPPADVPVVRQLRTALDRRPVLVCGSTVDGEERILLDAFGRVLEKYPRAVMVLAPRHPERFETVGTLLTESHIKFCRRSAWNGEPIEGGVLLLDSIGELSSVYALTDIAFVGGSLVSRGGHNILEPAQFGVPILVGRHTENFRDVVTFFKGRNAVREVTQENLAATFLELLANEDERLALGRRAKEALDSQRGATEFTLQQLRILLGLGLPEVTRA